MTKLSFMANAAPGTSFLRQKASTAAHKRDDAAHVHLVALLCVLDTVRIPLMTFIASPTQSQGGTRHPNGATDLFDASDYNEPPYIALYPPEGGLVSSAFEAIQRAVRCPLWHTLTSRVLLQTTFHLAASSQLYATPRTSPNSPAKRLHHLVRDAYVYIPSILPSRSYIVPFHLILTMTCLSNVESTMPCALIDAKMNFLSVQSLYRS